MKYDQSREGHTILIFFSSVTTKKKVSFNVEKLEGIMMDLGNEQRFDDTLIGIRCIREIYTWAGHNIQGTDNGWTTRVSEW